MLNRLYIVIGLLAITVLVGAFVVPRFIEWGDYRERMQVLASDAIGADVRISGDIAFTLLPQPRLKFGVVTVGPVTAPLMTVNDVEAEFSLLDFLRDRYTVTRLVLNQPTLDIAVDADGSFDFGLPTGAGAAPGQVSVSNALINDGQIRFTDRRSGNATALDAVVGELRLLDTGQTTFHGAGSIGARGYNFRFTSTPTGDAGASQLAAFLRSSDAAFSLTVNGRARTLPDARFEGTAALRVAPRAAASLAGLRGDMVFAGKVNATTDQVTFTDYTLTPDENRGSTRLTGAAMLQLGAEPAFNAVISGGVFALPPRDATEDPAQVPMELVRLIGEIPAPVAIGVPGRVGIDIAEFGLRAASLRNLRIDARTDGEDWTVDTFTAQLPGNTSVSLTGELSQVEGQAAFAGQVTLDSRRLDGLVASWRKPDLPNPLAGLEANYSARAELRGASLTLRQGVLRVGQKSHALSASIAAGENRQLLVSAAFEDLDEADSAVIAALLPETGQLGASFPQGQFQVSASRAVIDGLSGVGLVLEGDWGADGVTIGRAQAEALGDAKFLLSGSLAGTVAAPRISLNGKVSVAEADAPALDWVFDRLTTPPALANYLRRSMPLELDLALGRVNARGVQAAHVEGRAGAAAVTLDAQFSEGVARALVAPLGAKLTLVSADAQALTEQLEMGPLSLVDADTALRVAIEVQGIATGTVDSNVLITGGADSIAFDGRLALSPDRVEGDGALNFDVSDLTPVLAWIGLDRMQLPGVSGRADISFSGRDTALLTGIDAEAGGRVASGELEIRPDRNGRMLGGMLVLGEVDLSALVAGLAGPAALLKAEDAAWPDGPLDLGEAPGELSARVEVTTPLVLAGEREVLGDASFVVGWSGGEMRLGNIRGRIGGGTATGDFSLCCSGPLAEKQLGGRLSLDGVDLAALLDGPAAATLSGVLTGGVQFRSNGASFAELVDGLAGDGSYVIDGLEIGHLNPSVFDALAAVPDLNEASPDRLMALVESGLAGGSYRSGQLSGGFTLAGGTLRSANLLLDGGETSLSGSLSADVGEDALAGSFTLLPKGPVDAAGLVSDQTAPIVINLAGGISAPERVLDLQALADGVSTKALELELARLEQMRLEEEARSRAAAEERARLMLWQKREQAVTTAATTVEGLVTEAVSGSLVMASELAAERKAALALEAERARALRDEEMFRFPVPSLDRPIDLGLPPADRL